MWGPCQAGWWATRRQRGQWILTAKSLPSSSDLTNNTFNQQGGPVDMQASSTSRVHQTHSATRVTTGVEERETRQRVRKRARTRVRKHSHTPTPLAHGGKRTGGRLTATSHRGCAAQEPAAPLSMQGRHEHRQKPAAARGRGRARAREPGELTRGASAELFCARKTFVAALVLERRE